MKNIKGSLKIITALLLFTFVLAACSSRYHSDGRYRSKRKKDCKCPKIGYIHKKNCNFISFTDLDNLLV